MKIYIYLCEGPHDVAFLYKILKVCSYKDSFGSIPIKDLPFPFNSHFASILKNFEYQSGNLFGKPALPTILGIDNNFVLLYGVGGITKVAETKIIINNYIALLNSSTLNPDRNIEVSIAFIIDADDKGIENRTMEIRKNYSDIFIDLDNLKHNSIITNVHFSKIGLYIFSSQNQLGKLEDIIFPLMKIDNEMIFDNADIYFQSHFDEKRVKKSNKVDKSKSVIGIVGQLQYSGIANNSIIKQTDYLTDKKISEDLKCQEIIEFINKMKT